MDQVIKEFYSDFSRTQLLHDHMGINDSKIINMCIKSFLMSQYTWATTDTVQLYVTALTHFYICDRGYYLMNLNENRIKKYCTYDFLFNLYENP